MSPGRGLPWALLLLWFPGCFLLSGPSKVTGTVGGSLSVQCRYEEEHETHDKYWCRRSHVLLCDKIVETKGSMRKATSGRVTIRDHPANRSFTVTLESLTLEDEGTYSCGVDKPWLDSTFKVVVSVLPAARSTPAPIVTAARTSTTTTKVTTVSFTSHGGRSSTHSSSSQENQQNVRDLRWMPPHLACLPARLPVLFSLLAVLLLLLVGLSLLAWRIWQRRLKGGDPSGPSQNPRQAGERWEPQYANLQLHTWSRREGPVTPRQVEVEYSTVAVAREDLHCTSVVFDSQKEDSNANGAPRQGPQKEEPEYSVVKKPGNCLLGPSPP
ncbi:CMRF35-like molecule 8 isoform X3 [Fukomys damarensis]|uniref:CMRF35-like molecule 8 isoform X3 n=1 Tax=Fukomys damarensis TaxID=885580 RepID=UPI0005402604|nr:CMRF35-like molecule 8 isoform X3 [Fukomys damarensis]